MKPISPQVDLPASEREVLAEWKSQNIFQRSLTQRQGCKEFAFYDGPPFANGLPHYGHLLANTIKDSVPRYWTMRGFYVERRFGWDCHGLPVEYEIEKREGLKGRTDIMNLGVAKFNEMCRASVLHYAEEWEKTITRLGRWVDWSNQYRTMDKNFMESVWWVFGELFKKGFVYRSHKVVPYSPRITAVLSNFEANQNYKDVQDPALTVKFRAVDEDAFFLAWTTTPWTLISNLAICVGPTITYVKIKDIESGETYYLAEESLASTYKKAGAAGYEILARVPGSALAGRGYQPLFPYFSAEPNAFKVLTDAYVTAGDGTGIVHMAPAYGEDDFRVCRANNIAMVDPIDEEAVFKSSVPEYVGMYIKDADKEIIKRLKGEGKLLRHETLVHSYPFCERTDAPLIYRAIPAWYVAVEKISDKLQANNQTINWVPNHLRDGRMGKWLENARDWAISRNRFWGTPLPIWINDEDVEDIEVFSSATDLEKRCGQKITDLHKHFIDDLTFPSLRGKGTMRRIPEVFDCWFESGSMPYAQLHYPTENKDRFDKIFPADFIAEGLDQTRGWFYTLAVLSTALFGKPAFKNVIVNGIILDETGKKMSKRHRNYTAPDLLLEKYGADAVRLYMINSPILRAEDLIFTDRGVVETIRAVLLPLWNAQSFLSTYAAADGWEPSGDGEAPKVTKDIDRWILSRFQSLVKEVHEQMELYRLYAVVPPVLNLIEELTNWYIRLSRRRFWGSATESSDESDGDVLQAASRDSTDKTLSEDQKSAYATLYYVITQFTKVFAPFAPFMSDKIYRNLTAGVKGAAPSVHLCDMPMPDSSLVDVALEREMDLTRRVTNLGRSLRAKYQIKTRQALPSLLVITRREADRASIVKASDLIKGELNVKQIKFSTEEEKFVRLSVKPNLRTLGKRLGSALNVVRKGLEALSADAQKASAFIAEVESKGQAQVEGHALSIDDLLIERGALDNAEKSLIATEQGVTVLLDTTLTEELVLEGLAREVLNRVQKMRKDSNFKVTDRIHLKIRASGRLTTACQTHKDYLAQETLAQTLQLEDGAAAASSAQFSANFDIEGQACGIEMSLA